METCCCHSGVTLLAIFSLSLDAESITGWLVELGVQPASFTLRGAGRATVALLLLDDSDCRELLQASLTRSDDGEGTAIVGGVWGVSLLPVPTQSD